MSIPSIGSVTRVGDPGTKVGGADWVSLAMGEAGGVGE